MWTWLVVLWLSNSPSPHLWLTFSPCRESMVSFSGRYCPLSILTLSTSLWESWDPASLLAPQTAMHLPIRLAQSDSNPMALPKVLHFGKQGIFQCLSSLIDNLCFNIIRTGSRINCSCQNPVHFTIHMFTTKWACKMTSAKKPEVHYLIQLSAILSASYYTMARRD